MLSAKPATKLAYPEQIKKGGLNPTDTLAMMRIVEDSTLSLGASSVLKVLVDSGNRNVLPGAIIAFPGVVELARRAKVSAEKLQRIFDDELEPRYVRRHYLAPGFEVTDLKRDSRGRQFPRCYEIVQDVFNEIGVLSAPERLARQRAEAQGTKVHGERDGSGRFRKAETAPTAESVSDTRYKPVSDTRSKAVSDSRTETYLLVNELNQNELCAHAGGNDVSPSSMESELSTKPGTAGSEPLARRFRQAETEAEATLPPATVPPPPRPPTDEDRSRLEASKIVPPCMTCGSTQFSKPMLPSIARSFVCKPCSDKATKERARAQRMKQRAS
ncbi:MAG: hypothetical protein ACYDH5_16350 [Acidimicrobiales bacterium]